jgi:1-aminocyclopropane-1-carboxylate deaminase/D-cysteine desulfhydrase-like pyridoxal-dependent ACC family enzyme
VQPAAGMTTTPPRGPASEYTDARTRLARIPSIALLDGPTPVQELPRLRAALGGGPRLIVKRDDAIPFGFGGNKVRKLELAGAAAVAAGADTLVTVGGIQSNHARATAATATRLGLRCLIIANGQRPVKLTGNALLNDLLGADIQYITSRDERAPAMHAALERLRRDGRAPFEVPLGASTPLGALGFARAIGELVAQDMIPDVIVHASSSGGTQAGIVAGCTLWGLPTRVIGVSADDPAASIQATIRSIIAGAGALLGLDGEAFADTRPIVVDDGFVGDGYGVPSPASTEAQRLAARTEALFVDHAYTAKALGALIAAVRAGRFRDNESVLFWHTGGQAGLLA